MQFSFVRRGSVAISKALLVLLLGQMLCGSMCAAFADQAQPDPAGTATCRAGVGGIARPHVALNDPGRAVRTCDPPFEL